MKLYDLGFAAVGLAFLVGFWLSLAAVELGEPVETDSAPRGVTVSSTL